MHDDRCESTLVSGPEEALQILPRDPRGAMAKATGGRPAIADPAPDADPTHSQPGRGLGHVVVFTRWCGDKDGSPFPIGCDSRAAHVFPGVTDAGVGWGSGTARSHGVGRIIPCAVRSCSSDADCQRQEVVKYSVAPRHAELETPS